MRLAAIGALALLAVSSGAASAQSSDSKPLIEFGVPDSCVTQQAARGIADKAMMAGLTYSEVAVMYLEALSELGSKAGRKMAIATYCGEVVPGMSDVLVQLAWGDPVSKSTTRMAIGTSSIWVYPAGQGVVFLNGQVESVTTIEVP